MSVPTEPQPDLDDILAEEHMTDELAAAEAANNDPDNNPDGGDDPTPPAGDDPNNPDPADDPNDPGDDDPNADPNDPDPKDDPTPPGGDDEDSNDDEITPFEEQDLFIEVTGFESSAKDAKEVKLQVRSYKDLPEDFQFKDNREFAKFQRDFIDLQKAQDKQAGDKEAYDQQVQTQQLTQKTLQNWSNESSELRKDGRIPEIKAKPGSKAYENDEGVKRENEVYRFIAAENPKRAQKGLPPLTSFEDALDKLELKEMREEKAAAAKKTTQVTKAKSGMIGKSQPGTPGGSSKAIGTGYVAGSGMSPSDILAEEMSEEG